MVLIETTVFTRRIAKLLSDESYRQLQLALILRPEQGAVVPGLTGIRKLRWRTPGQGKRGGLRILYYPDPPHDRIYLLFAYPKSRQEDLTPEQARTLARIVREELL